MHRKIVGLIGMIIPVVAILSFITLFLYVKQISQQAYEGMLQLPITALNIDILKGQFIAKYFCYLCLGLMIIVFCYGLFKKISKSSVNNVGVSMIFISGLLWFSFGIITLDLEESISAIHFLKLILIPLLGGLGFMTLSGEFEKISSSKTIKWLIFTGGSMTIVFRILDFVGEPFGIFAYLSWLVYFICFGVVGFALIETIPKTKNEINNINKANS